MGNHLGLRNTKKFKVKGDLRGIRATEGMYPGEDTMYI